MSKLCKKCGKELADNVNFCDACGCNQADEAPAAPNPPEQGATNIASQPPPQQPAPAPKKKRGCLKPLLYALAGLVVIIGLIASCSGPSSSDKKTNTKPGSTASDSNTKKTAKKDTGKGSVHGTTVKADTMLQEFITNQEAANKKYKGETFKVTGKVLEKGQYHNDNAFYTIISTKKTGNKTYAIGVSYSEKNVDKINKIKVGDFVNLEVKCHGTVKQDNANQVYVQLNALSIFDL